MLVGVYVIVLRDIPSPSKQKEESSCWFFCFLLNVFFVIACLQQPSRPKDKFSTENTHLGSIHESHIIDPHVPDYPRICRAPCLHSKHRFFEYALTPGTADHQAWSLPGYHIRRVLCQQGGFRCGYQECLPLSRVLQPHDRVHRLILWKKSRNNMTLMLS